VDQTTLLGTIEAVVGRVEIAHERAGKRLAQGTLDHVAAAMMIDQKDGQLGVAEAPRPGGLAVDAPARFVALHHGRVAESFQQFLDDGFKQVAAPVQMAEQSSPADGQAKEIVQEIAGFAERDAQVGAPITSEQTRSRPDVGAGQLQVAATLTGSFAVTATMDVSAIAMPFELRLGNVGDDVVFELSGVVEFAAAAMGALLGMNVVFDEDGPRRRIGTKDAGMDAMFLSPPIIGSSLTRLALTLGSFTSLQKGLDLMFELRNAPPQLGVLRFEFGNPLITRVIHDPHSMPENAFFRKSSCLTITILEAAKLPLWTRVNEWLRHELREHLEGRWTTNHARTEEPLDEEEVVRHPEAEEFAQWEAIKIVGGKFIPGWMGFRQGCEFWHIPIGSHNDALSDIEIAWPDLVGQEYSERALLLYLLQQHGIPPTDAKTMPLADLAKLMLEGCRNKHSKPADKPQPSPPIDVPLDPSTMAFGQAMLAGLDALATNTTMRTSIVGLGAKHAAGSAFQPGGESITEPSSIPAASQSATTLDIQALAAALGDDNAAKILKLAHDDKLSVDQKCRLIATIDRKYYGYDSPEWTKLLRRRGKPVSDGAVRQTPWWREDRPKWRSENRTDREEGGG
jgi:hypothetical protein